MTPEELAERVARLEAVELARELVYEYAHVLDEPDPETVTALFAPEATLATPGGTVRGSEKIAAFYARAFAADPSDKRHFVVNPRASWLGASRVRVRSAFLYTGRDEPRSVLGWGTYDDLIDVSGPRILAKTIAIDATVGLTR